MNGLDGSNPATERWRRLLVYGSGFGMLVAGSVVVAAAAVDPIRGTAVALGVPDAVAARLAAAVAGGVVAAAPGAVGVKAAGRPGQWPRRAGGVLVGLALVAGWVTAPGAEGSVLAAVPTSIAAVYALGVVLVYVGSLASGLAPHLETRPRARGDQVTYRRRETENRVTPADGGEDEDDITSPIDDE